MRNLALLILIGASCSAGAEFGSWKMNPARSTFRGGARPRTFTVRIEPHAKGEVFTLDRIEADGRATSSSTILYLDGEPRDFQDFGCPGTQSSRRVDSQRVEILRTCTNGEWTRFLRQPAASNELVIDITGTSAGGLNLEWRIVLEKQGLKSQ